MRSCDDVVRQLRAEARVGGARRAVSGAALDDEAHTRLLSAAALDDEARAHLAQCASCRDTAALMRLLAPHPAPDTDAAWARLGERLAVSVRDETVALRPPPLGWRVALALAAGAGSLMLVPEPLRVLMALGVL